MAVELDLISQAVARAVFDLIRNSESGPWPESLDLFVSLRLERDAEGRFVYLPTMASVGINGAGVMGSPANAG